MTRKLILVALSVCLICPAFAGAKDPVREALDAVPADAMAFLCVPSVKQLDTDFQNTVNALQLQMFVPPPYNSITGMIRMLAGAGEHFDDAGALLLVILPAETPDEVENKVAFIAPTTDAKAMIESMGGQAGEGGVWTVKLFGEDSYAIAGDNRVVIGPTAEAVKAVVAAKGSIAGKLKRTDLEAMKDLDIVFWLNDQLAKMVKPQVDGFFGMMQAMQASGGSSLPFAAGGVGANKKQIDDLFEGMKSVTVGLSLSETGLGIRVAVTFKPGTELYDKTKLTKTTKGSLLTGLPGDNSMIAFGAVMDPKAGTKAMEDLAPFLELPDDVEEVNRLKGALEEMAGLVAGIRCSVAAIPPGPDGIIGATVILDTTDSAEFLTQFGTLVDAGKKLPTDTVPEKVKTAVAALSHTADAETIEGVQVQHLELDLSQLPDADEDWIDELAKIIGKEGVLFRMAAPDAKTVVIGFGGGAGYLTKALGSIKAKEAPLDNDPGIKKLAGSLPEDRASVIYIAVDRIITCIQNGAKAIGEEGLPIQMPIVDAPIAMAATGGKGWSRADFIIPMELIVQGKNAAMMMMGSMMGGGPAPGAAPPPSAPAPAPATPQE